MSEWRNQIILRFLKWYAKTLSINGREFNAWDSLTEQVTPCAKTCDCHANVRLESTGSIK